MKTDHSNLLSSLIVTALLALAAPVAAQENVVRHHTFDANDIDSLHLEYRVGTLTLESSNSDNIEIELTIKPERGTSWFRRSPNLEDMDLRSRDRNNRLSIEFDEKNVNTDWVVRLPALQFLEIEIGVGTIKGYLPPAETEIDLGVGSIELVANRSTTGSINLSVGVGDTSILGSTDRESSRAFVSSESSGAGDGNQSITIEAGVGDIILSLD